MNASHRWKPLEKQYKPPFISHFHFVWAQRTSIHVELEAAMNGRNQVPISSHMALLSALWVSVRPSSSDEFYNSLVDKDLKTDTNYQKSMLNTSLKL